MANPRVSQHVVEAAIEPSEVKARISQEVLDVVITPTSDVRVSQAVIEVVNNLYELVEATGTLSPTGTLTNEVAQIDDWLAKRVAKRIYLVKLTLRYASGASVLTDILYLSNHAYNTRADEDPANTEYITVLRDEGIPAFQQELSDTFWGLSMPSFGALVINNADGQFDAKLPPSRQWEGGEVEIKMTGDRSELALADAVVLLKGVMGKVVATDNTITVEVFSRHRELDQKQVPTDTFTGPNDEKIFSPILYGVGSNISAILKDPINLVYKVAGHSIHSITGVFDRAVLLSTSQYTVDLAAGEFTLNANPDGVVTCDVLGKSITGTSPNLAAKRGDFIYDLLVTYGGIASLDFDTSSLTQFNEDVPEASGIYITSPTRILDVISLLLQPVMGELIFNRLGVASIATLKLATEDASVSLALTADEIMPRGGMENDGGAAGDVIEIRQAEPLFWKVIFNYHQNFTVMDLNSIGSAFPVDPTTAAGRKYRAFLQEEWQIAEIKNEGATTGRNLYPTAGELGPLDSYLLYRNDANHWAQKWLDMFGVGRRIVGVRAKSLPLRTTVGAVMTLNYRWFSSSKLRIIKYSENWSENIVEVDGFI